jgi:hypothetical protein
MQLTRNAPTMPSKTMPKKKVLLSITSFMIRTFPLRGEGHTLPGVNRETYGCARKISLIWISLRALDGQRAASDQERPRTLTLAAAGGRMSV